MFSFALCFLGIIDSNASMGRQNAAIFVVWRTNKLNRARIHSQWRLYPLSHVYLDLSLQKCASWTRHSFQVSYKALSNWAQLHKWIKQSFITKLHAYFNPYFVYININPYVIQRHLFLDTKS